jgi:hypothetical protein
MPTLLEICLEELSSPTDDERYVRCVALPGGEPGLSLDREGAVRWMSDAPAAYGLWVSGDDQLILLRAQGAAPITVRRAGRALEAPVEMPVVLLDQDQLELDGRELRVHVHGAADEIHPPERLSARGLAQAARVTAAALALSAVIGAGAGAAAEPVAPGPTPIEVRAQPPRIARPSIRCTITTMKPAPKGYTVIHASCPASARKPRVGGTGYLLDASGSAIPNGPIVVRKVSDGTVVVETQQPKPVKAAAKIHIWVN